MGFKETIKEATNAVIRSAKNHSPEILLGIGISGVVGGTVMACRATLKLDDILDEQKERMNKISEVEKNPEGKIAEGAVYTAEDAKKDKTIVTVQTIGKIARNYAPAFIIEVAGIACICGSYGILKKREAAITSLLAATETAFSSYRKRVAERYGEDKEMDIFLDRKEETVTIVDEETGKKKKEKVATQNAFGPYSFIFDKDHFKTATDNPQDNWFFLTQAEHDLTRLLEDRASKSKKKRAAIYLDDILDRLGYIWGCEDGDSNRHQIESYTHLAGCTYDANDPTCDNCVDLGIADHTIMDNGDYTNENFIRGVEPVAILNINCSGNVWKQWADGNI